MAAERRTQEDLYAIEDAPLEMELAIQKNKDVDVASLHFRSAIIMASHNNVMVKIKDYLSD